MKPCRIALSVILLAAVLFAAVEPVYAGGEAVAGLWRYKEIVAVETQAFDSQEDEQSVLLSDLETMPLHLLSKVFGKLDYTVEFSEDYRFAIHIKVMGMSFDAQGAWSVRDSCMTLTYDEITGFEALWWLGGFDHLTHCDADHTMTETVAYKIADDMLTFYSNGANLVFTR